MRTDIDIEWIPDNGDQRITNLYLRICDVALGYVFDNGQNFVAYYYDHGYSRPRSIMIGNQATFKDAQSAVLSAINARIIDPDKDGTEAA